jgi:hypothetical protein
MIYERLIFSLLETVSQNVAQSGLELRSSSARITVMYHHFDINRLAFQSPDFNPPAKPHTQKD